MSLSTEPVNESPPTELIPLIRGCCVAVLVVSARDAIEDKVTAFDLGAGDYVTRRSIPRKCSPVFAKCLVDSGSVGGRFDRG
jgi:DNA-binding NarL/FixJ family response regulator